MRSPKTELDAPPPPTSPTPNHDPPLNVPNPISSPEQVANILDEAESSKQQDPELEKLWQQVLEEENRPTTPAKQQDFDYKQLLQQILEEEEKAAEKEATQPSEDSSKTIEPVPKSPKARNPKAIPAPKAAEHFPTIPCRTPRFTRPSGGHIKK
ncbi:hypothetical protein EDB85DRAFT_2144397 [Lactarius pseudohatsudake]|nr:hypothetical protein EDB85DRAFT_2144397 [Lactarius pseudohatsudake]